MKLTIQQIYSGEEEMIIRYKEMTEKLEAIIRFVEGQEERIAGISTQNDGAMRLLSPGEILYFESVDGGVFAYLQEGVYRVRESLQEVLSRYGETGFFRCSRTMLMNIYRMEYLKSEPGGRILATLSNGEKIMISRKYAGELRLILKKEA
ncbi:MAG: LytTR family transcriptional regulator DNA-binding domain-containing protein [Lachnospiraceae bacterium]|nr:LytTR family transcriptional regulator DNA-binding domain-containing protein [Lachnospiraceae bacterium]